MRTRAVVCRRTRGRSDPAFGRSTRSMRFHLTVRLTRLTRRRPDLRSAAGAIGRARSRRRKRTGATRPSDGKAPTVPIGSDSSGSDRDRTLRATKAADHQSVGAHRHCQPRRLARFFRLFSDRLCPCFHHQGMAATRFCFLESAMLLFNVCEHDTYQESDVCRRHRAC